MQYRRLGATCLDVSILSFGASSLGGVFHDVAEADAVRSVRVAIDGGINFIDVSPYYGLTRAETMLGKALRGIARDRYFIATKCGRYGPDAFDFSSARINRSIDESLGRLGLDHVDVLLAHDIEFGDPEQIINETIPVLQEIKHQGKTRFIGITGLPLGVFTSVVSRVPAGTIDVILSYCHYELNDTSLLGIVPQMRDAGVGVINASPLGMGLLSDRGVPDWHPAPARVRQVCREAAEHCASRGQSIMKLAVQFAVHERGIATTLVGSANPANVERNLQWIAQPIDRALLDEVLEILSPIHDVTWPSGRWGTGKTSHEISGPGR